MHTQGRACTYKSRQRRRPPHETHDNGRMTPSRAYPSDCSLILLLGPPATQVARANTQNELDARLR